MITEDNLYWSDCWWFVLQINIPQNMADLIIKTNKVTVAELRLLVEAEMILIFPAMQLWKRYTPRWCLAALMLSIFIQYLDESGPSITSITPCKLHYWDKSFLGCLNWWKTRRNSIENHRRASNWWMYVLSKYFIFD